MERIIARVEVAILPDTLPVPSLFHILFALIESSTCSSSRTLPRFECPTPPYIAFISIVLPIVHYRSCEPRSIHEWLKCIHSRPYSILLPFFGIEESPTCSPYKSSSPIVDHYPGVSVGNPFFVSCLELDRFSCIYQQINCANSSTPRRSHGM